jgi:hypothetical protein
MSGLFIDDRGEVWPADHNVVLRRLADSRPCDVVRQAVSLGFVYAKLSEAGMHIAFQPHLVSRPAASRLYDIIMRQKPTRATLCFDRSLSIWELVMGADRASTRIDTLLAESRQPQPPPLLYYTSVPLERYCDIAQGCLVPAL